MPELKSPKNFNPRIELAAAAAAHKDCSIFDSIQSRQNINPNQQH